MSLSVTRADEFEAASAEIGAMSSSIAGLPDSKLLACVNDVRAAIEKLVTDQDPAIMLTVWWCDPHPDHQAVGLAARHVGAALDIPVYGFPIWAQHWTHPRDVAPTHHLICVLRHTDDDLDRRRRAEARYKSQTNQVRPDVGPVLPDSFLEWDIEFCLRSR
jgi:LmbE family N-acetylglucosaminyl deacetylase